MQPPLIGLTTYGKDEHGNYGLPADYVDAVHRAKGIPVLIPPGEPRVASLLARLDGLILTGGGDLDPAHYAGTEHEMIYMVDPERDQTEIALSRAAVKNKLPLLGICRGMQVLNVSLGGTLIEHLPDAVGDAITHRLPPRHPARHPININLASRLGQCLKCEQVVAVSWHHQAVRTPAPGLLPVAYAPDGTIEALEMSEHPWLLAVQWHPEMSAREDPLQQRLFDALVQAAASAKEIP